jgi:flagellar biosynthesis chaperone FliJ
MSVGKSMKRLFALRVLEEEREETELRRQRRLRQACLEAMQASEARKTVASRALHSALDSGDRVEAISAEMALACGPLQRHGLQRRLAQLDALVETASARWQGSRVRRLQMETLVSAAESRSRKEAQVRDQKMLDGWFLTSRPEWSAAHADENFHREVSDSAHCDGTVRAKDVEE